MKQLQNTFQQIEDHALELESLLRQESAILNNRELSSSDRSVKLADLANRKNDLVQILDTLEKNRQFYLRSEKTDADLDAQWQRALKVLASCQKLNLQNGKDIASQARYTRRALEILGLEDSSSPVYHQDGRTADYSRHKNLGVA
ncbi:flagellar export chaperone FlgN [Spongiibacter sp. KMU-158]|uniref:Flagellar export chaperone FlgN n=1 Tax=Spongiibacter pelagi TaxID=2760804 RepID=A0A927GVS9_9GAMM|nr:flagellar export chaperone FlgN [Spongiibacter pelagi]MBD2858408.1 flagellar export chaperone FlgN [Spongiibacter pelagi]